MKNAPADLRLYYLQNRAPPTVADTPGIQTYFPSLEVLFPSISAKPDTTPTLAASELAVDISGDTAVVENILTRAKRDVPIWIRKTHLVEPIKVMSGEYSIPTDGALPTFREPWQRALRKLNDPYNEAYTDAIFACMASRLVETKRSQHFCRFFGTFNGRVPEYRYNITDDMGDIEGEPWFGKGLREGAFRVFAVDPWDSDVSAPLTEPWEDVRTKIYNILEQQTLSSSSSESGESTQSSIKKTSMDEEISIEEEDTQSVASLGELEEADIEVSGEAEVHRPRLRLSRISGSHSGSSGSSGSSEDDLNFHALLKNFPVQMTVLERCDGTMDDLMEDEIDEDATEDMRETKEERWTAWMFQVIAALTTAQQLYDFVHNDLHTNNVMWTGTGETHLYYHVQGAPGGDRYYRVPTYGRIFKIIDFGRATFRPHSAATTNHLWLPDAYAPDADAYGQYNCGPYFDQKQPKVQPNKSFDLCRLAVAMLDTLWPEVPADIEPHKVMTRETGRIQHETVSPLWNLLWLWLTDKHGRNLLWDVDGRERYPQFDLYCAIARDAQNAVPAQQLTLPLFDSSFRCAKRDIPADATVWKLQAMPAPSQSRARGV
jgi:hypothetical protein